jgi:hypothetical protein
LKEQILHLDPHDDHISARDKMGWVQTERVLLVWPAHGRVLTRRLDLRLLHRHAHRLGAHLALVTTDALVRKHAHDLGLPVFESVQESRRQRWRSRLPGLRPERLGPRPDPQSFRRATSPGKFAALPAWAVLSLKSLVLAVGLAAPVALGLALVPGATITLTPAAYPMSARLDVVADPDTNQLAAPNLIPARTVRVEIEGEDLTTTTGVQSVPSEPATGTVVFTNLIGTPATILQGTGVRTTSGAPVRFVVSETVTLEGRIGAAVEVGVRADRPGPAGNVAAGQINAVEGPLGLQLAVTNPAPTTGGTLTTRAAVTSADHARLRQQLLAQLEPKALSAIEGQLQPGEFLVEPSLTLAEVVAETYEHSAGEVADTVRLALRVAMTALVVNENDARLLAESALLGQVPAGQELIAGTMAFEREPALSTDADGRVHFAVTASGVAAPLIDREVVRQVVRGRKIPEAVGHLLARLPLAGPPHIEVRPPWYAQWAERLPWMPFRIDVIARAGG